MTLNSCLKTGFLVFGLLLIGSGVLLKWSLFPTILESMVVKQLQLNEAENKEIWDTWVEPSAQIPVYMKFTFFNVTNPDEIKKGAKPIVEEIGPFAYREDRRKEGIQIVEDEITYGSYIGYSLEESASCGNCTIDTKITVINPALVGIVALITELAASIDLDDPLIPDDFDIEDFIFGLLNDAINGIVNEEPNDKYIDDLFTTETANKLIFEGYRPGSLNFLLDFLPTLQPIIDAVMPGGFEIPAIIADGSFAFFKGKNGTADNGWYKINSGMNDMTQYQHILEYNGSPKLPESWWGTLPKTPSANRSGVPGKCLDLAGTDGTQYPPFVPKDQELWLFSSDLCRSIYLSYYEDVDMEGVETYQFRVKPEVLNFSNPENACFCRNVEKCAVEDLETGEWDFTACTHCTDGMLDLTGCQGAPVIISLPHFLNARPEKVESIQGLNPDPELHTTYLNIEPMTGVALDAHKRIQVNVPMLQNKYLDCMKNIRNATFPVVWVDEGASIGKDDLDELKKQLVSPLLGVDIGVGFMIGIGGLIILVLVIMSTCCHKQNNKKK